MSVGYLTDNFVTGNVIDYQYSVNSTIDGYTPKNKKCFCYPYNFLILTNNNGNEKILKYEQFKYINEDKITLHSKGALSQQPSIAIVPDYEGINNNTDYLVEYNNFQQLPWNYDAYKNWYALNSNSILFSFLTKGVNMALNLGTDNGMGAFSESLNMIGQQMSLLDKKKQPEQTKNYIQGNIIPYIGKAGIYLRRIEAKAEYIELVDNYFSRFGYQVNTTKAITITNRENFDYVQTTDCNITGNIPQEDIEELEAIFNNGLTIWHNENTYGDWNVSNRGRGDM